MSRAFTPKKYGASHAISQLLAARQAKTQRTMASMVSLILRSW